MTALKHVILDTAQSWNTEGLTQFLNQVPTTLESIIIPKLACVGIATISRHGPALRRLDVHQREGHHWSKEVVSNEDLIQLRDGVPNLEELSIDIGRHQDNWPPHDTLDIIAGFPRLTSLTLWFELGGGRRDTSVKPFITAASASELFRYLRQQQPACLQRLHVHSGAPPPAGHGLFFYPGVLA